MYVLEYDRYCVYGRYLKHVQCVQCVQYVEHVQHIHYVQYARTCMYNCTWYIAISAWHQVPGNKYTKYTRYDVIYIFCQQLLFPSQGVSS